MRFFYAGSHWDGAHGILFFTERTRGGREAQGSRTRPAHVQRNSTYPLRFFFIPDFLQQEKLGARIRDQQMARQKATEVQDAAIKTAVDKATTELRTAPSVASEELDKQHAQELRAQEECLVAKHHKEIKTAKESAPTPVPAAAGPTAEEQKAAIDAAVAAPLYTKEAEQRMKHQTDIEIESGRLEGTMKLRLKDTQLVRVQNKVKELELQIEEWRKAGVLPGDSSVPVPVPVQSASAASPTTTAPSSVPSPMTTAPAARGGAPAPPTCRPSVPGAPANQQPRGRGRGAVRGRGGIDIRGAAAPSAGRGAGGAAAAANAAPGGVTIMGAAAKRTREEGEVATKDSSLAKRLKPAVAAPLRRVRLLLLR